MTSSIGRRRPEAPRPHVDRWLRLSADVEAQYKCDHGASRIAELQYGILISALFYNVYNLTAIVLTPDILWTAVALRLGLVTPVALFCVWLIARVSLAVTEWILAIGTSLALLVHVLIMGLTRSDYGLFCFIELSIILTCVQALMAIRFRQICVIVTVTMAAVLVTLGTKIDASDPLAWALGIQFFNAGAFVIVSTYVSERRRCNDYLATYLARAETAETELARRKFRDLSRTDDLTGLPNRRHLEKLLDTWAAGQRPMALLMIDIDYFKPFNDTLGHPAGDACLQRVAEALNRVVADRPDAICGRLGGEEFTIAVRGAGEFGAARLAQTVLREIEDLNLAHPGRDDGIGVVTVSIGVGCKTEPGAISRTLLFARADEALYAAKRAGRNAFCMGTGAEPLQSAV